jgi:hypothetical protein
MPRKQTVTTSTINETPARKGLPWSSAEINRLHNEYELKELSVHEIADLHSRGVRAILHRLADEGLISTGWQDARGWEFPVVAEKKAPTKTSSAKKAVATPKMRTRPDKMTINLKIDETHDYTRSSDTESVSSDGSDEEYTLQDAQNDYDPYSMKDKVEFFKEILCYCK